MGAYEEGTKNPDVMVNIIGCYRMLNRCKDEAKTVRSKGSGLSRNEAQNEFKEEYSIFKTTA